jgi:hypothetical protein
MRIDLLNQKILNKNNNNNKTTNKLLADCLKVQTKAHA